MSRPTEAELKSAREVLRADYLVDVETIAEDVENEAKRMAKKGETGTYSRDRLLGFLEQSVDGSSRVINTLEAQEGLTSSDNDGAYWEENGEPLDEANWMRLMYYALRSDVIDDLRRNRDLDINKPFEKFKKDEDDETKEENES